MVFLMPCQSEGNCEFIFFNSHNGNDTLSFLVKLAHCLICYKAILNKTFIIKFKAILSEDPVPSTYLSAYISLTLI